MKKIIGLVLVALLLAACSEGPVQGFFLDLREHRDYTTAEVTFTCTNDSADDITKTYQLAPIAWVIQMDDMRSQLAKACNADIFASDIADLPGVDFDDVIGAYINNVTLTGSTKADVSVVPRPKGVAGAENTTFFFSRGSGGGNFQAENPGETQINHVRIGKGWGIYTFVPYRDVFDQLKLVDLNAVEWVVSAN